MTSATSLFGIDLAFAVWILLFIGHLPPDALRPQTKSWHQLYRGVPGWVVDATNLMEYICSSSQCQVSNAARLSHSRLNLPFSRSQLKLPLLVEVAGDLASSRVLPHELLVPSTSSGSGPGSGSHPSMFTWKSKQSVKGGALSPVASTCLRNARGR